MLPITNAILFGIFGTSIGIHFRDAKRQRGGCSSHTLLLTVYGLELHTHRDMNMKRVILMSSSYTHSQMGGAGSPTLHTLSHIHKHTRTHEHSHTHAHTNTHERTHTRTHAQTHTRTHTSTHEHTHRRLRSLQRGQHCNAVCVWGGGGDHAAVGPSFQRGGQQ
jgi:hypothetical protein